MLKGYGLVKQRHVPVLIAMIDDLCADADKLRNRLDVEEREVIDDIRAQGEILKGGEWPPYRRPQDQFFRYEAPNLNSLGELRQSRSRHRSITVRGLAPVSC